MGKIFKLKQNNTTVGREIIGGVTTFFAMAYIIVVNPTLLSESGMEWGAVFLATIIASIIGTLIMGLVANVPYALAPGMGLNAFFVYTVCFTLGFTWQQALSMVFICGLLNILITVTKLRKYIIRSIPLSLQTRNGLRSNSTYTESEKTPDKCQTSRFAGPSYTYTTPLSATQAAYQTAIR